MLLPEITPALILTSFVVSFAACFFSSLGGGGAGLILLPILLFSGLPYVNALASHKLAVGFIGIGGMMRFWREKMIDGKVFWWSSLAGVPFVIWGTRFAGMVNGELMKPIVGGVILGMVALMLAQKKCASEGAALPLTWERALWGLSLLAPMGFYSGWISAGSGIFLTFFYLKRFRYSQLQATAMMLGANGIVWNGVGAVVHAFSGNVLWPLAPGLILGALLGSYAGAHVGIKKGNVFVRAMFLAMASVTGVLLVYPALKTLL